MPLQSLTQGELRRRRRKEKRRKRKEKRESQCKTLAFPL
jgi:hypothetical protein